MSFLVNESVFWVMNYGYTVFWASTVLKILFPFSLESDFIAYPFVGIVEGGSVTDRSSEFDVVTKS